MNTLVIVLIAAVALVAAYALYGRWLAKKWGIDPKAQTPAVKYNDGKDYVPTNGWTVFSHQFSSIAGAGPVTGAIQAAAFGWLPVLLWVLIGGVFFGAVTDFGALYASVKNEGKSMGMLIEKYIGKTGPEAVSAVLLAVLPDRHCGLCRHGRRHVQRLHRGRWRDAARRRRQVPTALPVWCPSCSWCSPSSSALCRRS